jgi:hypothetical protein
MLTYTGNTAEDAALKDWVGAHCGFDDANVVVSHGTRARATVKPHDLVNSQGHLKDGRLVRLDTASPQHAGDPMGVFVTAEVPAN